jgi:hypothetical protein
LKWVLIIRSGWTINKKESSEIENMDRRRYQRVEINNLISYVSMDENGKFIDQSIGKALNISQSGLFLETPRIILSDFISLMSIDQDNKLIEIIGRVAYSRNARSGKFGTGIDFQAPNNANIQFAMNLVKVFSHRKNPVRAAI